MMRKAVLAALLAAVKQRTAPKDEHAGFERYRALTQEWRDQTRDAHSRRARARSTLAGWCRSCGISSRATPSPSWMEATPACGRASYNPILAPRSYLYTAKFGHLGTGLPYAIGAKLAAPDRPVYLISGDGAIGFNIQELETARRYGAAITVVVSCDRGWGMERSSQMFAQIDGLVECDLYPETRYDLVAEAIGLPWRKGG